MDSILTGRLPADGAQQVKTNNFNPISYLFFDSIHDGAGRQAGRSQRRVKL
jgi:hypothetical protein